jgi:ClpP class serine protease
MSLLDMLTGPWAIVPDKLLELQAIYATHLRGDKIDVAGIEARLGRPLANEQKAYEVQAGGVAVLTVRGVMSPRANLMSQVSGGVSTETLRRQVEGMHADSRVRSVVLAADSHGGNVLGLPAAIEAVRALAADKPTVLVGEGTVASAMYWLGSAANAVFMQGNTDHVGSLGVYARIGWSPKVEGEVEMVRGKYKRAAINGDKPSAEFMAYAEGQLDYLYTLLIDDVARHRGASSAQVLDHMADGRVFIGQQAIDAGLVDGVSTVDAMVERLATNPAEFAQRRKAVFALGGIHEHQDVPVLPVVDASHPTSDNGGPMAEPTLTRESMERDHAALFAQVRSEGAQAERDRVAGVRAALLPGHEALIEQLVADGTTTPAQAAAAVIAAERETLAAAAAAHRADAPPAAPGGAAPADTKATPAQQVEQARAYAAEHKVDFVAACKALGLAT